MQWCWFHRVSWCVFIKGHSYSLCDAASHAMDRARQNVDYYSDLTDMAGPTVQHVVCNKQRFVGKLGILTRNDFWDVRRIHMLVRPSGPTQTACLNSGPQDEVVGLWYPPPLDAAICITVLQMSNDLRQKRFPRGADEHHTCPRGKHGCAIKFHFSESEQNVLP